MYYIYLIRCGKKGAIKIGHARNVERRMAELQTGNPTQLFLITAFEIKSKKHAQCLETQFHRLFKSQHIRGEWFYKNIKIKKVIDFLEQYYSRLLEEELKVE